MPIHLRLFNAEVVALHQRWRVLHLVTCVFVSEKVLHTLSESVTGRGGASGMRKRMTRIREAVAAYALAAGLLIAGAAVLTGTVIRQAAAAQAA